MMKNKYIVIIASCFFIIIAGVSYTCSYNKRHKEGVFLSTLEEPSCYEVDLTNKQGKEDTSSFDEDSASNILQHGESIQTENIIKELELEMIYVHLCGAIVYPDVYHVEAGTRLVDIIEMAGGLTPEAAGDYINQAMVAEDGQRIYIPTKDELKELTLAEYMKGDNSGQGEKRADKEANSRVNINTADETELMSLPGIGQAKAKSIVEYRKKNGDFKDATDLKKIPGIKDGLFGPIADLITVK